MLLSQMREEPNTAHVKTWPDNYVPEEERDPLAMQERLSRAKQQSSSKKVALVESDAAAEREPFSFGERVWFWLQIFYLSRQSAFERAGILILGTGLWFAVVFGILRWQKFPVALHAPLVYAVLVVPPIFLYILLQIIDRASGTASGGEADASHADNDGTAGDESLDTSSTASPARITTSKRKKNDGDDNSGSGNATASAGANASDSGGANANAGSGSVTKRPGRTAERRSVPPPSPSGGIV